MAVDVQTLPVILPPETGESGPGFLLRVAQRNGLALKSMLSWLGVSSLQTLTPMAIRRLAHATDASYAWLQTNLTLWKWRERYRYAEWYGHGWSSLLSLRGARPQVCPDCLREGRPCQAAWEMTGAFACLGHRRLLIDRCHHCDKPLTWTRPAVEVCGCGRYISAGNSPVLVDCESTEWIALLLTKLHSRGETHCWANESHQWLSHLSADGAFNVIYAAGVRLRPCARILATNSKAYLAPAQVAQIVRRGVQRLHDHIDLDRPCSTPFRELVYEQGLERLHARGETVADRAIAGELLAWVRDVPRQGLSLTGRRPLGQLDLFQTGGPQ